MPIMLAAALAVAVRQAPAEPPPPAACQPPQRLAARAPTRAAPHPLSQEPLAERMHAVLRRVGGCMVVDVSAYREGAQVWELRLAGPADGRPRPAADGR